MSWQIINVEPAFGVCDQCKKHDCGIIDGQHKWIMTGIYDRSGDSIIIGYRCVEIWASNLGISREVVEQTVLLTPTDEQIGDYVRKATLTNQMFVDGANALPTISYPMSVNTAPKDLDELLNGRLDKSNLKAETRDYLIKIDRDNLKLWLKENKIEFVPQWGEERLREEALKHV